MLDAFLWRQYRWAPDLSGLWC